MKRERCTTMVVSVNGVQILRLRTGSVSGGWRLGLFSQLSAGSSWYISEPKIQPLRPLVTFQSFRIFRYLCPIRTPSIPS